ncbi:DUF4236 domain-containing protein [Mucilaginibacter sp. AW1-3]
MRWSYHKSFGKGPFRVNLSKSGVSFSAGVKGARIHVGPRGTRVSLRSHGVGYNRKVQLPQKAGPVRYAKWFGTYPLVIFILVMLFTSFGSKAIVLHPASDSVFVRVNVEANIRRAANGRSAVIKTAQAGQIFRLLDTSYSRWLKVSFADSAGFINRRFAFVEPVHHDAVTEERVFLADPYAGYILVIGIAAFTVLIRWLGKRDRARLLAISY